MFFLYGSDRTTRFFLLFSVLFVSTVGVLRFEGLGRVVLLYAHYYLLPTKIGDSKLHLIKVDDIECLIQ